MTPKLLPVRTFNVRGWVMDMQNKLGAMQTGRQSKGDFIPAHDVGSESAVSPYRAPEIIRLGSAVELLKQSSGGQLIDGNEGWWVWGS